MIPKGDELVDRRRPRVAVFDDAEPCGVDAVIAQPDEIRQSDASIAE